MSILTNVKCQEYVFNGSFDYSPKSLEGISNLSMLPVPIDSMLEFNGKFYPDKNGFFKQGLFVNDSQRYNIVGHLHRNKSGYLHRNKNIITHFLFAISPVDCIDQHCIYSVFNNSHPTKNTGLDGIFVGGWYLNCDRLDSKSFRDYKKFKQLADQSSIIDGYADGRIEGYARLELKRVWDVNTLERKVTVKKTFIRQRINGLILTIKSLSEECTNRLTNDFKEAGKNVDIMGYVNVDLSKASLDLIGTADMLDTIYQYATMKFGKDCQVFALHPHDALPESLKRSVSHRRDETSVRYCVICKKD